MLLKSEHQTTSVDTWAAGVILLCLMSRTYPFFRAPDDVTALAELSCLFGIRAITEAASQYGKRLLCNERRESVDLASLCQRLASRDQEAKEELVTEQLMDLLKGLLKLTAHDRTTAEQALKHPFLQEL